MDKELAESYVRYQIGSMDFSLKAYTGMVGVNGIFCLLAIAFHHTLAFVLTVAAVWVAHLLSALLLRREWSAYSIACVGGVHFIFLVAVLNLFLYALYHVAGSFAWLEYLAAVAMQLVLFSFSMLLVPRLAKRHQKDKKPSRYTYAWAGTSFFAYFLGRNLVRHFSESNQPHVIFEILSWIIGIMSCLCTFIIANKLYLAYLIKKHDLTVDLKQLAEEREQGQL